MCTGDFIRVLLLTAASSAILMAQKSAAVMTKEMQASITPDRALQMLEEGNARFVSGQMVHRDYIQKVRLTSEDQYPFAVILGCLDSRQSAEILFDQGIGDIFVARVAGNVLNDDILGSLEFATKVDDVELDHLTGLLRKIKPAVESVGSPGEKHTSKDLAFVDKVAAENAKRVAQEMRSRSRTLRDLIDAGNLKVVSGMYEISTGRVTFADH